MGAAGMLADKKVLLVEDELLIALMLEDILTDEGAGVVGPFSRLSLALPAARSARIDLALLDVNVGGEKVYPVAEILEAREIPFLLLSGYGARAVPANRPAWVACSKPFKPVQLVAMLVELCSSSRRFPAIPSDA